MNPRKANITLHYKKRRVYTNQLPTIKNFNSHEALISIMSLF